MKRRVIIVFVLIFAVGAGFYVFQSRGDLVLQFQENQLHRKAAVVSAKTAILKQSLHRDWRRNDLELRRQLDEFYDDLTDLSAAWIGLAPKVVSEEARRFSARRFLADYRIFDAAYVIFFSDYVVAADQLDFSETLDQLVSIQALFQKMLARAVFAPPQAELLSRAMEELFPPGYIFEEFRLAELIDVALTEGETIESIVSRRPVILKLKEDLILTFSGRLASATPELEARAERYLILTPGNLSRRLALLDEVRENVIDSDLKTRLNVVRQELLKKIGAEIDRVVAEAALTRADRAIAAFQAVILDRQGEVSRLTAQILERAEFHADQAEVFFKKRNYVSAFGQATAARVAAENALLPLAISINEYRLDIEMIESRFDSIKQRFEQAGIADQEVVSLLVTAEEQILTAARLLETESESRKTFETLRALKILMGGLTELTYELI